MFALNPGGSGSTAGSGGGGGGNSALRNNLWFFGKLGLYFVGIRLAFVFMSGGRQDSSENNKAIEK